MMEGIFKKSNCAVLLAFGLFFLLISNPVWAAYSGHVASFKSKNNAVKFVNKVKAKGVVAYYRMENVPAKGELFRVYVGNYKTQPLARKNLAKLKKEGVIDYFQIQKTAVKIKQAKIKKPDNQTKFSKAAQIKPPVDTKDVSAIMGKKQVSEAAGKTKIDINSVKWNEIGFAAAASGKWGEAVDAFTKALELDPKDAGAYYNRGNAYLSLGNFEQAIKDYNKAEELNPKYAGAYYDLENPQTSRDNYSQEIAYYDKAIELNPRDAESYYNRGMIYGKLGLRDQEVKDLKMAAGLGLKEAQSALRSRGVDGISEDNPQKTNSDKSVEKPVSKAAPKQITKVAATSGYISQYRPVDFDVSYAQDIIVSKNLHNLLVRKLQTSIDDKGSGGSDRKNVKLAITITSIETKSNSKLASTAPPPPLTSSSKMSGEVIVYYQTKGINRYKVEANYRTYWPVSSYVELEDKVTEQFAKQVMDKFR